MVLMSGGKDISTLERNTGCCPLLIFVVSWRDGSEVFRQTVLQKHICIVPINHIKTMQLFQFVCDYIQSIARSYVSNSDEWKQRLCMPHHLARPSAAEWAPCRYQKTTATPGGSIPIISD